jgi:hypothetical protein
MIFKETLPWIFDVSPHTGVPKTQTRRPELPGDLDYTLDFGESKKAGRKVYSLFGMGDEIGIVMRHGKLCFKVGQTYVVQPGRGKLGQGRIVLVAIRHCPIVAHISPEDAVAEGFATPDNFRAVIKKLYGEAALQKPFYALTFEPVQE